MNEALAQLIFWTCMACGPLTFALWALAYFTKSWRLTLVYLIASTFTLATFLWYFHMLGVALADVTGTATYPSWGVKYLISVAICAIVGGVVVFLKLDKNSAEQ